MKRLLFSHVFILFLCFLLNAQDYTGSFPFDGINRKYEVYLPQDIQPNMPLVINLHGNYETIYWYKTYTEMHVVADTMGYVLVYPQGTNNSWNAGIIIPGRNFPDTDDVGFIAALIDTMKSKYDIDLSRVYACGFSLGGMLSFRLAGECRHRFAAVASVAGPLFGLADTWVPVRPIPVLQMHGTADSNNKYEGEGDRWPARKMIDYWVAQDSCLLPADTISLPDLVPGDNCTVEKISYLNCAGESRVIHYKIINGGHSWPGSKTTWDTEGNKNLDINANVEILKFFRQFSDSRINSIPEEGAKLPTRFNLNQNYPNPFNPVTMISYQLSMNSFVEISVYNLLGQRVATLVNRKQPAGHYQVQWDAASFSSGVYLYRIQAGSFVEIRKMLLVR